MIVIISFSFCTISITFALVILEIAFFFAYLEKCGIYSRIEDINTDTKTLSFTLKLKFADDIEISN